MFLPRFVLYAFKSDADRDRSERASLRLLWALIDINLDWLAENPGTPALYASGLRYSGQEYMLGQEDWMDIPSALLTCADPGKCGIGTDCKVLVGYRCAELRAHGIDARPWLLRQARMPHPDGTISYGYHVIVKLPGGAFEDPSKILGMKSTFQ